MAPNLSSDSVSLAELVEIITPIDTREEAASGILKIINDTKDEVIIQLDPGSDTLDDERIIRAIDSALERKIKVQIIVAKQDASKYEGLKAKGAHIYEVPQGGMSYPCVPPWCDPWDPDSSIEDSNYIE